MDFSELVLILVIVVMVFWGARHLSPGDPLQPIQVDTRPELRLVRGHHPVLWTRLDWFRICAAVVVGVLAVLALVLRRPAPA